MSDSNISQSGEPAQSAESPKEDAAIVTSGVAVEKAAVEPSSSDVEKTADLTDGSDKVPPIGAKPPVGEANSYPADKAGTIVDLTGGSGQDPPIPPIGSNSPVVQVEPYNADKARDLTRQTISLWLIGVLCSIVALSFIALFASGAASGFAQKEFFSNFKQLLDVILPPVTTLLASTIGFYFGYKQGELITAVQNASAPPRSTAPPPTQTVNKR